MGDGCRMRKAGGLVPGGSSAERRVKAEAVGHVGAPTWQRCPEVSDSWPWQGGVSPLTGLQGGGLPCSRQKAVPRKASQTHDHSRKK